MVIPIGLSACQEISLEIRKISQGFIDLDESLGKVELITPFSTKFPKMELLEDDRQLRKFS